MKSIGTERNNADLQYNMSHECWSCVGFFISQCPHEKILKGGINLFLFNKYTNDDLIKQYKNSKEEPYNHNFCTVIGTQNAFYMQPN